MNNPLKLIPLTPAISHRPVLIYLPGMDGSGILIQPQLQYLKAHFEVWGLALPSHDRRSWDELLEDTAQLLTPIRSHQPRSIYLCGESFGGCLALKLLHHYPHLGDRLILVNSASAFQHQPVLRWSVPLVHWFAPTLYTWATHGLLPFLADWERVSEAHRHLLLGAMQSVHPETAAWRLSLLDRVDDLPQNLPHPTLVIAAAADRLLPSVAESDRLLERCTHSQRLILPFSGHTCLLETEVNLVELLEKANFFESDRLNLEFRIKTGRNASVLL